MVFYLVWLLVGMLGNGIVMQYAIKLVFCLVGSLVFLWLRKGHMYSCGLKKNGMKKSEGCPTAVYYRHPEVH